MSWRCTFIRHRIRIKPRLVARFLVFLPLLWVAAPAAPQTLEYVLMPGPVIEGHADLETDCRKCHVVFSPSEQPRLCVDCHEDIGDDIVGKRGYHGKMEKAECRACHTDHKGREARIVNFNEGEFDHRMTDFLLWGGHSKTDCDRCHASGAKHRDAANDCGDCHYDQDVHDEEIGAQCEQCHDEFGWKGAEFEHSVTDFELWPSHTEVPCTKCHAEHFYSDTPAECVDCHSQDDKHEGHFGGDCGRCHQESAWPELFFAHDWDTDYPLRGLHRTVSCDKCHLRRLFESKTTTQCFDCHRKKDVHKAVLGAKCEKCHSEFDWQELHFDHDRDSRFGLRGAHENSECDACHKDTEYKIMPPRACVQCHRQDDREKGHRGRFGGRCRDCHSERDWTTIIFDHQRATKYPLRGKHRKVGCNKCHKGRLYEDKVASRCNFCHKPDDVHKGELDERCENCHTERDWKETTFDHRNSEFALLGRHQDTPCDQCHNSGKYKDISSECIACHARDDKHEERLGPRCGWCHDSLSWETWSYDHDRLTRFRLDGAHRKAKCVACHTDRVQGRFIVPMKCYGCHKKDDVHFGTLSESCEACHGTGNWREVSDKARRWADDGGPPAAEQVTR